MPFPLIPVALSGLSALSGLLGNRDEKSSQQSTSNNTNRTDFSNISSNHNYQNLSPEDFTFMDTIRNRYTNLLNNPDISGYMGQEVNNINRNYAAAGNNAQEILAARGITGGPASATSAINNDQNRIRDITQFQNNAPLLQRSLYEDTLGKAVNAFSQFPKDTYSDSTNTGNNYGYTNSSGTGTGVQDGNMLGGLTGNLSQMLAFLFGQGALGGKS
jgi:hypothetical protein